MEDTDDVVMDKYNDGDFPLSELECPTVRAIVQKCWKSEYVHGPRPDDRSYVHDMGQYGNNTGDLRGHATFDSLSDIDGQ